MNTRSKLCTPCLLWTTSFMTSQVALSLLPWTGSARTDKSASDLRTMRRQHSFLYGLRSPPPAFRPAHCIPRGLVFSGDGGMLDRLPFLLPSSVMSLTSCSVSLQMAHNVYPSWFCCAVICSQLRRCSPWSSAVRRWLMGPPGLSQAETRRVL